MSWEIVNRPSTNEMAKLQERGLSGLPSKTCFITLDGPTNAFASSKDGSQIAVAGRSVFKIISLDQDKFQEKINLRVGRINLNFSITDVQWHPVEDNILATAAGNGAIVTWNLNKITKQKQEQVFTEHKRTVNRIKFHPVESSLLLSAGQDGTMKCFDIRKQTSIFTCHCKHVDVIRDVEFSPFDGKLFTAACETGNVQLWDMRRTDMYYHQFMAHNGPIFTLDWHPEERNWIATGGRDKFVKVWDVQSKATPVMNSNGIQTITSVARVKWRPQRKYQLASCALLVDFDIHVWDIRRPYIPYATFSEHKDTPTGIMWRQTSRGRDPNVFLSCSKDSTLYQHMFSDAHHPAENAPPVAIALNVNGDLSYAKCDQLTNIAPPSNTSKVRSALHLPPTSNSYAMQKRFHDISDNFTARSSSSLFIFSDNSQLKDESFKVLAKSYKLSGRSLAELCEYNSKIANSLSLHKHAQTWSVLKTFYSENMESLLPSPKTPNSGGNGAGANLDAQTGAANPTGLSSTAQPSNVNSKSISDTINTQPRMAQDASAFQDDDDSSSSSSLDEVPKLMSIASGGNQDFLFGDDPDDGQFFFDDQATLDDTEQDWTLPSEAFQPRQIFIDRPSSPRVEQEQERPESPLSNVESDAASASVHRSLLESNVSENTVPEDSSQALFLPKWDFTSLVLDVLNYFAEEGDVQMCVSLLIVLGDRIRFKIDEQTQEHWLMSYIDLLRRQEMYAVANEIVKLSSLPVVNTQNQQSTTVYTSCKRCNKPLVKSGWFCKRCQSLVEPCSLCHLTVKGSYVWCQGCGHGGHLAHLQEWFSTNIWCPAGCGHICEFT